MDNMKGLLMLALFVVLGLFVKDLIVGTIKVGQQAG